MHEDIIVCKFLMNYYTYYALPDFVKIYNKNIFDEFQKVFLLCSLNRNLNLNLFYVCD